jgi:hypothetical protein
MPSNSANDAKDASQWCSVAVFDPTRCRNKEERALDNVIYFYPHFAPDNLKMNHVGLCIGCASLAENFSDERLGSITTSSAVTSVINPFGDVWLAATVPVSLTEASGSAAAEDVSCERMSTLLRSLLREVYSAFLMRFGADAIQSPPTVEDFFDRFCAGALPLQVAGGSATPDAVAAAAPDRMAWLMGLATRHTALSTAEYHTVLALVSHCLPSCTTYVVVSHGQVLMSTAGMEVTHSVLLLLQLYGAEIPSFAGYLDHGMAESWCHAVHCGNTHHFFAFCDADDEAQVSSCAADVFQLCDRLYAASLKPRGPPRSKAAARGPQCHCVSLNFGSRSVRSSIQGSSSPNALAYITSLCGAIRGVHDHFQSDLVNLPQRSSPARVRVPGGADAVAYLLRHFDDPRAAGAALTPQHWLAAAVGDDPAVAPRAADPTRPSWFDASPTAEEGDEDQAMDVWWLAARDTWMVVRHADRRTVGMLFVDAISWCDIADEVERTTASAFHNSCAFIEAGSRNSFK